MIDFLFAIVEIIGVSALTVGAIKLIDNIEGDK